MIKYRIAQTIFYSEMGTGIHLNASTTAISYIYPDDQPVK